MTREASRLRCGLRRDSATAPQPEPVALREFYRVLKPAGALAFSELITDPDYPLGRPLVMRAGVLRRLSGLLIIIGYALLAFGKGLAPLTIIPSVGVILSGLGYAWCGYSIWAGIGAVAPRSGPAM